MNRREFCAGLGAGVILGMADQSQGAPQPVSRPSDHDPDPAGGYTLTAPRQFLFFDYRHIKPGDVRWKAPDGQELPLVNPPDPRVEARADGEDVAQGIHLMAHKAVTETPVAGLPNRVLWHEDRYQTWSMRVDYGSGQNLGSYSKAAAAALVIVYGESPDGYAWTSREICTIKPPSEITGIDGEYFFIDPHGPAEERYKCVFNARVLSGVADLWKNYQAHTHPRNRDLRLGPDSMDALFGLVSPDGQRWKALPEPLLFNKGDTDNTVYFDSWLGKYVLYTRLYWMQRRMVARAESEDFRHWSPVEPIIRPQVDDPFSYDVYTNAYTSYPGLPEYHLMFPILYRRLTQTSEAHLYTSIDGFRWDRVPGGAVLESDRPGSPDGGFLIAGKQLVPLGKDKIAIPYTVYAFPHKYPRWPGVLSAAKSGWATWPRGRLCGLQADGDGRFDTFRVQVTGSSLRINAKVDEGGEIRVGLRSIDGRSIDDCDPIIGDHFEHTVTWKGDSRLRLERGQSVNLRFRIRAAELYGFEWCA